MGTDEDRPLDPDHTVELLWNTGADQVTDVRLSLSRIVTTAVDLADADGLAELSMRRIAERLGYTTMALYRHVPGKAELIDLMRDAVYAEIEASAGASDWRSGLAAWARDNRDLHRRHRWLVDSTGSRRVPGPNIMSNFERVLAIAASSRLPPAEVLAVVDLIGGFVDSAARSEQEVEKTEQRTGQTHQQWWEDRDSLYERVGDYPTLRRLWESGGYDQPVDAFEFGLERTLDGIELLVRRRDENRDGKKPVRCEVCGAVMPEPRRGRPRSYCSRSCQQRAYRRRQSSE
ncbi:MULTISPECIES: TetR/AcrR family transcriptional regulator C-terminal domain-containing protein [Actinoalloteichus]|uniref:Transcriptional regulator, TetR family n=1 Tax=Actinoalloteichus fjordicus TaxID=1612552 RepID=A0AAC9PUH4_9PSEU|nr:MULTISPECIES: TetR/AcrR family transcriptional regulator C-terminal domain-containing protein [Actinoalloteichus]APU17674.1 transcriptional regulator, TetR family [Actinoalloteichus fjordicus]APU23751.1 transcriptional regulator, TetR family [Actinoalloteichus sp. GBA129-24]